MMRTLFEFRRLTAGQLIFDVTLAVACVLLRFAIIIREWPMMAVVVFMGAAFALRRSNPGLALAIAWLGALVQLNFRLEPDISNLAILPVLYATAAYGVTRIKWAGLISAGAGAMVATGYVALYPLFRSFAVDVQLGSPSAI